MKKTIRRAIIGVVVLAVGATAVTALGGGDPEPTGPIKTANAQLTDLRILTNATGTVQPIRQIALSFPAVGRVTAVNVEAGKRVAAGDVLAEIDGAAARIEVKSREAALAEALARVDGLKSQVTAADRAVYEAPVAAAESSASQARRSVAQQSKANKAVGDQLDASVSIAENQEVREGDTLTTEQGRLNEAQVKLDRETEARAAARSGLDSAKVVVKQAQERRDKIRDQIAALRQEVARLGLLRDDSQRDLDKAIADVERLRAAQQPLTDANGNQIVVVISDSQVVAARSAFNAASSRVANVEADIVRVQANLEVSADALALVERDQATLQNTFDTADGRVVSAQAAVDGYRQRVDSQQETVARSSEAVVNAERARSASERRDAQAIVTARNQQSAAEAGLRTAQREQRQRQQGAKPSDVRGALAAVDGAAALLELAEETLGKTKLLAPFDAVIASVGIKVGEQIGTSAGTLGSSQGAGIAGTIVLVDASSLIVRLPLPEVDAARVEDGDSAEVIFESLIDSKPIIATIESVEPTPTVVNGVSTYTAKVLIQNAPPTIRLGMTATVEILLDLRQEVLTIPAETLLTKDGVTSVGVVQTVDGKDTVTVRPVELGDRSEGRVEVTKGLKDGEKVEVPMVVAGSAR